MLLIMIEVNCKIKNDNERMNSRGEIKMDQTKRKQNKTEKNTETNNGCIGVIHVDL